MSIEDNVIPFFFRRPTTPPPPPGPVDPLGPPPVAPPPPEPPPAAGVDGVELTQAELDAIDAEIAAGDPEFFGRAPIRYVDGKLDESVADTLAVMATHPQIFSRAGRLVWLVDGALAELPAAVLRSLIAETSYYVVSDRRKKGAVKAKNCPDDVLAAVWARGYWPGMRRITAAVDVPTFRPDGTIFQDAGHDEATGVLYQPTIEFERVPDSPTKEDAEAALRALLEPFEDFPFASPAGRSVVIASILTLFTRSALGGGSVPLFVFEANMRGSGKTLLSDLVSIIFTGAPCAKMTFPDEPAEQEKTLSALSLTAKPIICFDNLASSLGGAALDKCLTAGEKIDFRVLGKSQTVSIPWVATILASGNNVDVRGDTTRRVLVSRIETPLERPEDRTDFKIADVRAWARANRPRLVVACLTILRAWAIAGRPRMACAPWGSFEAWAAIVPPAIVFAGGDDTAACKGEAVFASIDAGRNALATLLDRWRCLWPEGQTCAVAIRVLYPKEKQWNTHPDDAPRQDMREALESLLGSSGNKLPTSHGLSRLLHSARGTPIAGMRAKSFEARNVLSWRIITAKQ